MNAPTSAGYASAYGPGLYGNRTACGQRLTPRTAGVAHRTYPCGTLLTIRHAGRTVRARVIDRGPFIIGRDLDLAPGTWRALGARTAYAWGVRRVTYRVWWT